MNVQYGATANVEEGVRCPPFVIAIGITVSEKMYNKARNRSFRPLCTPLSHKIENKTKFKIIYQKQLLTIFSKLIGLLQQWLTVQSLPTSVGFQASIFVTNVSIFLL